MTKEKSDPKRGKYVLLYSESATKIRLPNKAKTNDGATVNYTCLHEQNTDWRDTYKWPDAKIVGYINRYDQIVAISRDPLVTRYFQ